MDQGKTVVKSTAGLAVALALCAATSAALELTDDRSFRLVLKEPFGMVTDILAKTSSPVPYMMRERDAMTDANTPIKEVIGSGPFRFVASERVSGSQTVYERNPAYVPRS